MIGEEFLCNHQVSCGMKSQLTESRGTTIFDDYPNTQFLSYHLAV